MSSKWLLSNSLFLFLFVCIIQINQSYAHKCGHDNKHYDIYRNDNIEPKSPSTEKYASLSKTSGATNWLLDKIENAHHRNSRTLIANEENDDIIQTFSSRKNTKPHRHHASPHAFEHNVHHRHYPKITNMDNDLLFIDEDENESLNKNIWKPFRIHYNSDSLMAAWSNQEEAQHFAENVIPAAMHYLERSLFVRPIDGKLKLSRPCVKFVIDEETGKKQCIQLKWNWKQCGSHVTIPSDDFEDTEVCELDESESDEKVKNCKVLKGGKGHSADIIIYFSGDSDYGCSDVYGYSAYCHSNKYDRPIAGFVNLCEDTLVQKNRIFTWEQKVTLVVHEVFHVLGFSSTGFAYFRYNDKERTPRTPRDKMDGHPSKKGMDGYKYGSNTIQYHHVRDKFATFIVLPTVVKYAKKFFKCKSVIGIELEDFGGHDTAASHWEQRILGYEFMIGYIPPAAPFSIFSFAVLEDSGWYKVNWKYASQHPYGRQFGCDWIDDKCLSDNGKDMLDPLTFCSSDIDYGCSKDHIAISNCQIEEYNFNLPPYFQYFTGTNNRNIGGRLEYADYCPMYYHYNNGDCRFPDASIKHKRFGATITPQSKCTIISHPDHHYLNLKMQGFDGSAIVNEKQLREEEEEQIKQSAAYRPPWAGRHRHFHRRKKPLPKELGVCYKQECFTNAKNEWSGLRIEVWNREYEQSEWITCWKDVDDGRYKITQLHEYDVRCPVFSDICYDKNPWLCNGHGMLDRMSHECVCNAGYIGCDCLHDDTAENREKYPYSDHQKCQEYNIMKQNVFEHAPLRDDQHRDTNEADIWHDIIWNEIDVPFGEYHMKLLNVRMDMDSKKKYVKQSKTNKEQFNLDFIQVAKNIKLLIAIPLKIDVDRVWIENYKIVPNKLGKKNLYNVEMELSFRNQQRTSNKELAFQMKKILHDLFDYGVSMETLSGNEEHSDDSEEADIEDAQIEYRDNEITFGEELEHNSKAYKYQFTLSITFLLWPLLVMLL